MPRADDLRAEAVRQLPLAYSLAVRLREAGLSEVVIAESLGIEVVAVGPLLSVAEAKIAAILARRTPQ